jgi:hypothetical protein
MASLRLSNLQGAEGRTYSAVVRIAEVPGQPAGTEGVGLRLPSDAYTLTPPLATSIYSDCPRVARRRKGRRRCAKRDAGTVGAWCRCCAEWSAGADVVRGEVQLVRVSGGGLVRGYWNMIAAGRDGPV